MYSAPTIKSLLDNMYPPEVTESADLLPITSARFETVAEHAAKSIEPRPWRKLLDNAVLIAVIVLMGGVVTLACIYS